LGRRASRSKKDAEEEEKPAEEDEELKIPRPKSRLKEIVEQEQREEEKEPPARAQKKKKEEDEIVPVDEEIKPEPKGETGGAKKEEDAAPAEEEKEEKKPSEEEEEITPVQEETGETEEKKAPEEEEIKPESEEEVEKEAPEQEEEKEEEEKPQKQDEEIEPEAEGEGEKDEKGEEIGPESGKELNPVEKTIVEKYGDVGLKVYALIDGQKTAEEIMNETGVSEAKLIEMLEFMEKQGIIKLEHPEAKAAAEAEEEKEKFAPLADQGGVQMKDLNPVEAPAKIQLDMLKAIQMRAKIALQYGEKGGKIFDSIDGKASDVDISLKLGIALYEVRDALSFLASNRMITARPLNRDEITKRYGEDCFAVYKRYGREGVLLYELIGKDMSIKQMAQRVTKEKQKFAEMFIFVHKVLGVDIPIDKDVIFSQLGESK
jgi:hypothetical protein